MKMDWKALGYQAKYQIIDNQVTVIWENIDAISEAKSAAEERTMFKNFLNGIICRFKGHVLREAGTCPYTGSTYDVCTRCLIMIPIQLAE